MITGWFKQWWNNELLWDKWEKVVILAAIAFVLSGTVFITACSDKPLPSCNFNKSQIVYSVLDGRKGQVVWIHRLRNGCQYDVRFANDRDMQRIEWMKEFELREQLQ